MPRDNFSKRTVSMLGERVGFLCCNPHCRSFTVGPNHLSEKSTRIGKAAHITAASINGPRYDNTLTSPQRSNIENGIWLCSNCSDLIDKDELKYPAPLLKIWKANAEFEMSQNIRGVEITNIVDIQGPYLEADLVRVRSLRSPNGYSDKNPGEIENGVYVIDVSGKPIIHWALAWELSLIIYNNSSYPAYNISVNLKTEIETLTKAALPKINNLPAFDKIKMKITYMEKIEDTHIEADRRLACRLPEALDGVVFQIEYLDEKRNKHETVVSVQGQQVINDKS